MTAEELGQMIWNVKELLRNVYDNKDVEDVILPFTLLRLCSCQNKILFNELYNTSQQYSFIQFLRICLL